jgi:hypothetical protein
MDISINANISRNARRLRLHAIMADTATVGNTEKTLTTSKQPKNL